MIQQIMHVGLTVSDIEKSIEFYRDVLGLKYIGMLTMEGKETDVLFGKPNSKAKVAYLNGSDDVMAPPVELIQFTNQEISKDKADLFKTSISEICFAVQDLDKVYKHLIDNGVECISAPQPFDFTSDGFGKSKAIYFKDPDGIILELMQSIN